MKRFYLYYGTISVLILGVVFSQILFSYKEVVNGTAQVYETKSAVIKEAILSDFNNIDNTLLTIVSDILHDKRFLKNPRIQELLSSRKKPLEQISTAEIRITDAKGIIIASSTKLDPKKPISNADRDYFIKLKDGYLGLAVSEPIFGKIRSKWLIFLGRGIFEPKTNKFLGAVYVSIELDFFSKFVKKIKQRSDDLFAVAIGDSLKFAYRAPASQDSQTGAPFKYHENLKPMISGQVDEITSVHESKVDQFKRLVSGARVGQLPIFILVGTNYTNATKIWMWNSMVVGVISFLSLLMLFILGKRLVSYSDVILKQQEEIVESVKLRSLAAMAGSVSHEVGNPLTVISGNARRIEKIINSKSNDLEAIAQAITVINKSVERVRDILDSLKTLSGKASHQNSIEDLGAIIKDSISNINDKISEHHVDISFELQRPDIKIKVNQVQMSQVLINCINNSVDAIANDSKKWIKITAKSNQDHVVIKIIDSGKGIPAGIVAKMMDPFFTTKDIGKGTGLGLGIAKKIIENFNGKFYYDQHCSNTTFVIELPKV